MFKNHSNLLKWSGLPLPHLRALDERPNVWTLEPNINC